MVQGELLEMSRRIREGEGELEKLRKEGEQLQTSLPEVADHIWGEQEDCFMHH